MEEQAKLQEQKDVLEAVRRAQIGGGIANTTSKALLRDGSDKEGGSGGKTDGDDSDSEGNDNTLLGESDDVNKEDEANEKKNCRQRADPLVPDTSLGKTSTICGWYCFYIVGQCEQLCVLLSTLLRVCT